MRHFSELSIQGKRNLKGLVRVRAWVYSDIPFCSSFAGMSAASLDIGDELAAKTPMRPSLR